MFLSVPKMKAVETPQIGKIQNSEGNVCNLKLREVWERTLWHCIFSEVFEGSYIGN